MNKKSAKVGKFWGVPYDWRRPTKTRFKSRWWNPRDKRFVTPRTWGWGYALNLYWLFHSRNQNKV